jgi:hypothetical protein
VELLSPKEPAGYLAHVLLNEVPFPGEQGWVSEQDTKAAMLAILWVLHSRIEHIPEGYSQKELATVNTRDILDVITAGGERGQCDGFFRDAGGAPSMVPRVPKRLDYLLGIANKGSPGKFAALITYGQELSKRYFAKGITEADRFARVSMVGHVNVTGRAYSWMTDQDIYHPGGDYIHIPDDQSGSLGGNRFSTLKERK